MYKRVISFLLIVITIFTCAIFTGCKDSDVPLPEEFSLLFKQVKFDKPTDSVTLYDGPVLFSEIKWSSSDESVATFKDGVVTAKGMGTAEVYAEYFGVKHTCFVDCSTLEYSPDILPKSYFEGSTYSGNAVLAPPESFDGPSEYYNNAAFIGDSVSLKLSYYAQSSGELGSALFLVSGSYGVGHAVDDTMMLVYQGKEMSPQEALKTSGVDKVFVMLGMNDLGKFGLDITMDYWEKFVANIKEACPEISICIQSMTPVYAGGQTDTLYNEAVDEYNEVLKKFAKEQGLCYMDIASFMKDSEGALASDYCSDNYVHLTDDGASAWTKALKAYAGK